MVLLKSERVLDGQGGVYACGIFSGTATFDSTTTVTATAGTTYSDNFLAKWDTTGNLQWIKTGAQTYNPTSGAFQYYGTSELKYQDGSVYMYAANVVDQQTSASQRVFDGIQLPNSVSTSQFNYVFVNSFVLKTSTSGTNDWLTPLYGTGVLVSRTGVRRLRETAMSYTVFHVGETAEVYCEGLFLRFAMDA